MPYGHYNGRTGRYQRVEAPQTESARPGVPPPKRDAPRRNIAAPPILAQLLPKGLDAGDLMLAALLLFLYIESRDEDFLIMLLVVGASMLRSPKGARGEPDR